MGCLICERIEQIQKGCNPYFVCELETGYVVLGDHQRFAGYTLFLCKQHETELHLLPWDYRMKFFAGDVSGSRGSLSGLSARKDEL